MVQPIPHDDVRSCLCANLRRAARAVSQVYSDALRPAGLTVEQFNLLATLSFFTEITLSDLAARLGTDRTTLSRNLKPLQRKELVADGAAEDQRVRMIRMTDKGREVYAAAEALWRDVQRTMTDRLGDAETDDLIALLKSISSEASEVA